ncbi:MAG: ribonucleotide reductase N-terminal alpha domain-containing protein [Betaproteobacteria bacterium]
MGLSAQAASLAVLRWKYAGPGEATPAGVNRRVARALAGAEAPGQRAGWAMRFEHALQEGFIPAGRILAHAGLRPARPLINCYVQPLGPGGSADASDGPCLADALDQTARTLALGGGVGLDFSALARAQVLPALHAFEQVAQTHTNRSRPGALMGVLHADHPDLEAFIDAKAGGGLTHFNLSVGLSDAFMQRVQAQEPEAGARWQHLVHAAWHHGEPGVLFLDTMNRDDSLAWRETLRATNPCGEQPLPAYGSCCLGSIDLSRLVRQPFTTGALFDDAGLSVLATAAVRMLDNVIDLTTWPLAAQRQEALLTRRIGLGFTGLADALIMLGLRYDRAEGRTLAAHVARVLRDSAVHASVALARERGPYPLFDAAKHLAPPGFASRLPAHLQRAIAQHGLRNSHLLSVAPAGSISLAMADNVASGIEPVWAWRTRRPVRSRDGTAQMLQFKNHGWRLFHRLVRFHCKRPAGSLPSGDAGTVDLPPAFVTVDRISALYQLAMAEAVAPCMDAAVSKTVLLPQDATPALVSRVLRHAWQHGLKGVAVYRPNPVIAPLIQPVAVCAVASPR